MKPYESLHACIYKSMDIHICKHYIYIHNVLYLSKAVCLLCPISSPQASQQIDPFCRGSRELKKRTTRARLGTANGERFVASSYLVGSKNVTDEVLSQKKLHGYILP